MSFINLNSFHHVVAGLSCPEMSWLNFNLSISPSLQFYKFILAIPNITDITNKKALRKIWSVVSLAHTLHRCYKGLMRSDNNRFSLTLQCMNMMMTMMMMTMMMVIVDDDDDDGDSYEEGGNDIWVKLTAWCTGRIPFEDHCIPRLTELRPRGGPRAIECAS